MLIKMSDIHADDNFNCRGEISFLDVTDLAKDIRTNGLLQPVIITQYPKGKLNEGNYKYLLVAGYRRFKACQTLELQEIECVVRDNLNEGEARIINLSENVNRKQLDIVQEALAIQRLHMWGMPREEIARQVNMSPGWVQVRTMLLELPKEVWAEAKAGSIKQTDIRNLHSIYGSTLSEQSVFDEVKRIKDRNLLGRSAKISRKEKVKGDAKLVRTRTDILERLEYMQSYLPNGLWSRCLAWAAGEISNNDLDETAEEHAISIGRTYRAPIEAMT